MAIAIGRDNWHRIGPSEGEISDGPLAFSFEMSTTSVSKNRLDVSQLRHFDREKLIYDSDLKPGERHILLAVNSFVGADGECFPKQSTLADMTGYRREAVNRILKGLEAQGVISIKHQFRSKGRGQTSNRYSVNWPELANRNRETVKSRGVTIDHTYGCDAGSQPGVTIDHTINCPIELSNQRTDQEYREADSAKSAPTAEIENSGSIGKERGGEGSLPPDPLPEQPPKRKVPLKEKGSAATKQRPLKWNPSQPLPVDHHGWIKLPPTSSVPEEDRGRLSAAKAHAVRETQLWLSSLIEQIQIEEEDGELVVEHINGVETEKEAFSRGGDLSLRKLRGIAVRRFVTSKQEFNETLESNFWEHWEG